MSADAQGGAELPGNDTTAADLTKFQLRILQTIYLDADYGLGIKETLDDYYDEETNHGRLYPNLNQLVDAGLVAKSELDKRTNQYELTTAGADIVQDELNWVCDQLDIEWIRGGD